MGGGSGQAKAGGARQNTSEQPNRKQGVKGKQNNAMRSTSTQREDAFQSTASAMQATFISGKKQPAVQTKEQLDIIKETEMEFRRRQGFKRIFPSIDYAYYKQFFV